MSAPVTQRLWIPQLNDQRALTLFPRRTEVVVRGIDIVQRSFVPGLTLWVLDGTSAGSREHDEKWKQREQDVGFHFVVTARRGRRA
jgi:hypothetical protein